MCCNETVKRAGKRATLIATGGSSDRTSSDVDRGLHVSAKPHRRRNRQAGRRRMSAGTAAPVPASGRRRQGGSGPTDSRAVAVATKRAGQMRMRPAPRRRRLRFAALLILGGLFAGSVVWSVGLIRFAHTIPDDVVDDTTAADAIVVLTGGSERLATGLRLLAERKGERVFISGVHPGVPVADLLRVAGIPASAADSRIETGYGARDTAGNAEETATWMRGRGYHSLRLVTGSYHMPRSLLEFQNALPEALVIPHPVFPHRVHQDAWWRSPGTAALIVTEYSKYLFATARHRLGLPNPAALRDAWLQALHAGAHWLGRC